MSEKQQMIIPEMRLRLKVEEGDPVFGSRVSVTDATEAARIGYELIGDRNKEFFVALYLDTKLNPISYQIVAIGSVDSAMVDQAEIFKGALLSNAKGILLFHNHSSGDPVPSAADINSTEIAVAGGTLLGIQVMDHVIVTPNQGVWRSLRSQGDVAFTLSPRDAMTKLQKRHSAVAEKEATYCAEREISL